MTPEGWRRNEANRWLAVAAKDLHAARLLTKEEPWAAVFHCQQAAGLTGYAVVFRYLDAPTRARRRGGRKCADNRTAPV